MARLLVLTSPARGHAFPITPALLELRGRGHHVVVRTLTAAVEPLRAAGLEAEPLASGIEARELDDWRARTPLGAQRRAFAAWMDRADIELDDTREAIARHAPDALLVDTNAWGATAVAEATGLPLARFHAFPLPMRADGVPPFGPGLPPLGGASGRARDRVLGRLLAAPLNRGVLPRLNAIRARAGAAPVADVVDAYVGTSPLLLLSAEPFEYRRSWPAHVHPVGPGLWDPPAAGDDELLAWVDARGRDLVLVSVSSEYQGDGRIVATALEALAGEDVTVVATAADAGASAGAIPANARVVRFASHEALLPRAAAVVCHAGMGVTQKALAHGVPVCAIPWGRDQLEVARRVVVADAGARLTPGRLSPGRLRAAVAEARGRTAGAQRVAAGFRAAGGPARAADLLEALVPASGAVARPGV